MPFMYTRILRGFFFNVGDDMNIFDNWEVWVIIYLISAVIYAHTFKNSNRNMKNANCLTVLLESFTAFFAFLLIPFFKFSFSTNITVYLILIVLTLIYAVTDRLNIEARYGLNPSTFSMLKQLSTVFMLIFGFLLLKEKFVLIKFIGALIILFANLLLTFDKGKIAINKYFIMCFISNFLFAVAMLINTNISDEFNLAFYTLITVFIPSLIIRFTNKITIKDLKEEYNLYNKREFLLSAFTWCLMLISSVKAYQLGNVTIVAPLFALTSIINVAIEFFISKNKDKLLQKIISAILLILGVVLIKL